MVVLVVELETGDSFLVIEERDQDDDRDRHAEKPKQNSTAHITLLMLRWRKCWTPKKQSVA
jgi:hypothetical protein